MEVLAEFGLATLKAVRERPTRRLPLAALGLFLLGAMLGGLSLLAWPERVIKPGPLPGLGLIISPLSVGGVMHAWGAYRRRRGYITTNLATFAGGAAFALGSALVRFLWAS